MLDEPAVMFHFVKNIKSIPFISLYEICSGFCINFPVNCEISENEETIDTKSLS